MFTHLHVHSQYSILDGAASIGGLVKKAKADGMTALALTDHGNMFGAKLFYDTCKKNGVKPILGVEAYVAQVSRHSKENNGIDRSGEHLIILAKNLRGYKNLVKLCSLAYMEGMYYKPRIDKELLEKYKEGLIVSSACLGGEIAKKIVAGQIQEAEETALWYKNIFGGDYYLEVMRHPNGDPKMDAEVYNNQVVCIKAILQMGEKLGIKVIASNDVHFLDEEDAEAHDLLICINTHKDLDDPTRMRYTWQEWFKTTKEMQTLFADLPEVLENTQEITAKVEEYTLDSAPIMPVFPIPAEFGLEENYKKNTNEQMLKEEFGEKVYEKLGGDYNHIIRIKFESDYLKHLTLIGMEKRWANSVTAEISERIEFELDTIKKMGFPGYFLIVQDFIAAAREMGVIVGPGRGSAAGSAVAYCLGITNIDPLKYDLLFERFLNPDRISMPDIDIDFDDEGRQKVLDWVTEKYGQSNVAHIITFGSMAAKVSIRDVARVLKLELPESKRLTKMVPETPKMTLEKAFKENPELEREKKSSNPLISKTLRLAETLEGSIRQTSIHACGILISRDPLTDCLPVMLTEGENLLTTQYDGHFVEPIGLIKMDFLGLRTLSIIKTCLKTIKISKSIDIDIDQIPLDDKKTYELFSRGETTGLFQFESTGMKKHLKALQPNRIEDLVAMNALYRPGPMEYIPKFISRKLGKEPIVYDHPMMETYLKDTYGVTVYQEQVMLLSRTLANFTRGQSDTLRKAMGKKDKEGMDKLKSQFIEGCHKNPEFVAGCQQVGKEVSVLVEKIWTDWEAFASYAFNKSHSVCYAYIAYQTGFLKAHYPAEFMAANLSHNLSQMEQVSIFMDECKRMGLKVLSPDVNESFRDFTVTPKGYIRFGMAGISGVGEYSAEKIIEERQKNGNYKDIFDFLERVDYKYLNKKSLEGLIASGGVDSFGYHRAQYFRPMDSSTTQLESLVNYGQKKQNDGRAAQSSLFGGMDGYEVTRPEIQDCEKWTDLEQANKEKELLGIYLTSHPLDRYLLEIKSLCTRLDIIANDMASLKGKSITIAGIITDIKEGTDKNGNPYGKIFLEDFTGKFEIAFFRDYYVKYRNFFIREAPIFVKGKVQERSWKLGELEFSVTSIDLLHLIGEKLITSITLHVDVEKITSEDIKEINEKFICRHPKTEGTIPVDFLFFDNQGNRIKMLSRTCQVTRSQDLYGYFENNEAIKLKIN
ncbi:DNA-directed DNA polymerase [Bacteroidia bacterium]|nr:DNA-directed DNA polymerase [Bacteroidia bacterium]